MQIKINLRKTDSREEQQPQQLQKRSAKKENLEAPLRTTLRIMLMNLFLEGLWNVLTILQNYLKNKVKRQG